MIAVRKIAAAMAAVVAACSAAPERAAPPPAAQRALWAEVDDTSLDTALADLAAAMAQEPDTLPPYLSYEGPPTVWTEQPLSATEAAAADLVAHRDLRAMFGVQHPMIDQWIDYFTTRGRNQFIRFYERLQTYGPALRSWLREEGVPEELIWLAFIESGINPLAYSRAHAAGIWQFISATGRRYGLRYDFWLDDRRDPERSTRAAARHLHDLFSMFGSWELALSAYNAGPHRVRRAIAYAGHDDYWRMVHQRYALPRETRNYVPKLIAAQRIGSNPSAYGFDDLPAVQPLTWQTLQIPGGVTLKAVADAVGVHESELRILNLHLRRAMTPPGQTSYINIPAPYAGTAAAWIAAGDLPISTWGGVHTVRSGDTLWEIARAYETSVDDLVALNNLRSRRIYPGQQLVVPTASKGSVIVDDIWIVRRGDTLARIAARAGISIAQIKALNGLTSDTIFVGQRLQLRATVGDGRLVEHVVRYGDTLWKIAQRYGSSVDAIRAVNGLRGNTIRTGQTLKVPTGPTS